MTATPKRTIRRAAAACLFTAIVAGSLAPRFASAHTDEEARNGGFHLPEAPKNLRVQGLTGTRSNAVIVAWDPGHSHRYPTRYRPADYELRVVSSQTLCTDAGNYRAFTEYPDRCMRRVIPGSASVTEIVSGLNAGPASYFVTVTARVRRTEDGPGNTATGTVTFPSSPTIPIAPPPPEPGTPSPPGPVTSGPVAQVCTWKHRIVGIPGSTGGGYTAQILISSEEPNATARIRAFQVGNGQRLDVLDKEGNAVESVTLTPLHSVKEFRLEGARGWHTAIVEHATARAMRRATVAVRLRGPDVGVSVEHVAGIEHCEPTASAAP